MDKREVQEILDKIGLSPAEIAVYVALLDGVETVQDIMRVTAEKRPTVYYSLNSLEKRGLVSKTGKEYGNKYQVEPLEKLTELVERSIRKQNKLLEQTEKLKALYKDRIKRKQPVISHYDSIETIRAVIFYSLYGKGKVIRTIVPGDNFFHEMGEGFIKEYVKEKIKRGIKTKALWEDIPSKKIIEGYYPDAEIKQLPIDMHNSFKTTIFIYDDKTLYIAPKGEMSAVMIESREHADMMNTTYDHIWSNSLSIS